MCSVLLVHGLLADAPLAVLFVRDEEPGRAGRPPAVRPRAPGVLAPWDPREGGTWFGLSRHGFLAGLVNRRGDALPEGRASRGRLLLEALGGRSAAQALRTAHDLFARGSYGGLRFFAGDPARLAWIDLAVGEAPSSVRDLSGAAWLLRHTVRPEPLAEPLRPAKGETTSDWFRRALAQVAAHRPEGDPLCHHGVEHASVDTTLAALDPQGAPLLFFHAGGPPCGIPPGDLSQVIPRGS